MATKASNSRTNVRKPPLGFLVWAVVTVIALGGIFYCLWRNNSVVGICTAGNLQLTAGQQSGAAGTIYQHIALTNTGAQRCTLTGYPTAFLFGNNDTHLAVAPPHSRSPHLLQLHLPREKRHIPCLDTHKPVTFLREFAVIQNQLA
jgi:hypothetical protein